MQMLKKTLVAFALVALAMAGTAQAQVLSMPSTTGALTITPYLTDTGRVTVTTVTNTNTAYARTLHVTFISGTDWTGIDRDCVLTPFETTYFIFESGVGVDSAKVTFECSNLLTGDTDVVSVAFANGANGVMVTALEDPNMNGAFQYATLFENSLLADSTVLDFQQGLAFSVNGWHYQAVPYPTGYGDRDYLLDGVSEYTANPAALLSNFISPDEDITAELVLFTPDGRVGAAPPGIFARLFGFAFDDDENPTSGQINYDCFTITALDAAPNGFGPNVRRDVNPNAPIVGHLSMAADLVVRGDIHELSFPHGSPDSPGSRRSPSIGWLVQTIGAGGDLVDGAFPMSGASMAANGAWARQLNQPNAALQPAFGDRPGIDAR